MQWLSRFPMTISTFWKVESAHVLLSKLLQNIAFSIEYDSHIKENEDWNREKLTKEDIDKVRGIEDSRLRMKNIIALSDAPYYTACPNPFIEEFIRKCGHTMMKQRTIITENRLQQM